MIWYTLKILLQKKSLGFLLGMVFVISLIMLNLVSQVGTLVDANLEYGFKEYRPHSVYRVILDFGRNSTNLTPEIRAAIDFIRRGTSGDETESGVLIAFSWSLLRPVRIGNHTVNVVVYLFKTPRDLSEFGFEGNFSNTSLILLKTRLKGNLSAEEVISRFFNGSVVLRKAYGKFREYPLLESKEIEYVQIAAPLREWIVNACIRRGNSLLINSSGYMLPVYVAVNFRNIHHNPDVLEQILRGEITGEITNSTVKFYQEKRCRNKPMVVFGDGWAYINGTWLSIKDSKELEYKLGEALLKDRGKWCMMGKLIGPELEGWEILTIVRDSGGQAVKFFELFGGLLVVFYLPLFLVLIYSASTTFKDLRKDLETISLRGIRGRILTLQKATIFLLSAAVSLAGCRVFEATSGGVSHQAELAVMNLVLISVAVSEKAGSLRLSKKTIASVTAPMALLIALGVMRLNETIFMAKGYAGLSIFLVLLKAMIPLFALFIGPIFQELCLRGFSLLEGPFDTRYYFRWTKNYGPVVAFSAYSLAIALLPLITSIQRIPQAVYQSGFLRVVGYSETVSLELLGRYVTKIGEYFELLGLLALLLLMALSLRRYSEMMAYSSLRGIGRREVRKTFLKFTILQLAFLTLLTVIIAVFLTTFVDAYIGLVFTRGSVSFERGRFLVESLFKPPHVFIWG